MLTHLLLFAGACIGHTALIMFVLNWLYGCALPRRFLRYLRRACELVILASPFVLWYVCGFDLFRAASEAPDPAARYLFLSYGVLCEVVGLGVFPIIQLRRLLRRPPAVLLSNHSRVLNIARELSHKPVGDGKHSRLSLLPFNQVFQVELSERTLQMPRLSRAWDGLTILHISDLHLCGTPDREFYDRVVEHCREWDPDLVAVTGDVVDSSRHHRWVVPVLSRLKWRVGAMAILGNHDYLRDAQHIRQLLRRAGLRYLGNSWEQHTVRGEPLIVIGNEAPWCRPAPDLRDCPQGPFRLCLSHTPDQMAWARRHGIDLMLAGHNHGGQIRFPVIGSVFVPAQTGRKYDCGTFHEPPTVLHVSRGLAGQHPLRFNCRPEVTKIVLRVG